MISRAAALGLAIYAFFILLYQAQSEVVEGIVRPCIVGDGVSRTYYGVAVSELGNGLCRYFQP